jgi:starch synthase
MTPYLEMTAMADIARALPQKMQDKDMEVRVFMPRFGIIKERKHRLHEVIRLSGINVPVGDDDNPLLIKVASLPSAKMQIYFLDNDDFFNKRGYFHDEDDNTFYADNDERTIFFNKGAIEIILKLGWIPDVIHCHGWMGALVPMYARTVGRHEPVFKHTKFIYTIYEDLFEERLGDKFIEKGIVNGQDRSAFQYLENPGVLDFYKTGITFADGISFGSQDVNPELVKMAYESNKPILPYQDITADNFAETYYDFYQTLLDPAFAASK